VFISLHYSGSKFWLETKALDRIPMAIPMTYLIFSPPVLSKKDSMKNIKFQLRAKKESDSINEYRGHPKILMQPIRTLSLIEWTHFEKLLSTCHFWKMNPSQPWNEKGFDGSTWIIEAHQKNNYWFVNRWSPRDDYRDCGEYLIKLSGLKEEIY
jgi:hypothetical protein